MNKNMVSGMHRQMSSKVIKARMMVVLVLISIVLVSSFALAGDQTKTTEQVSLLNGYKARGSFTATRTAILIMSTGGARGKADYVSPTGTAELRYMDCAVPYALVTFYSGGAYSESRWSEPSVSWAITPSYNTFSISKVRVSGGLYDTVSRHWVARAKDAVQ